MNLKNSEVTDRKMLAGMYADGYFPDFLVDKVKQVLLEMCREIEDTRPSDAAALLKITHAATEKINALADEFGDNDSELETVAREVMAAEFDFIVKSYGFTDVNIEEVIAPRDW